MDFSSVSLPLRKLTADDERMPMVFLFLVAIIRWQKPAFLSPSKSDFCLQRRLQRVSSFAAISISFALGGIFLSSLFF